MTPEPLNHDIFPSPSGSAFVTIDSLYDTPPITRLRSTDGQLRALVATADISRLKTNGWRPPTLITVPSAAGDWTNYSLLFEPSDHDAKKTYPLIDMIYPGPSAGPIRVWGFTTDPSSNPQALAELGFDVLLLQASGTPERGRAYQLAFWGDLANGGLADHVSAIRTLAASRGDIDLTRVGIVGYSAGGDGAARAIFTYPEVFRAAASVAGSYNYRATSAGWTERYQGLLRTNPDGSDNYPAPTFSLAPKLRGKLLLASGALDDNVNPAGVYNMISALESADKNFEFIPVPNANHWPFENPYFIRRLWDFLEQNVAGLEPPPGFQIKPKPWSASDAP